MSSRWMLTKVLDNKEDKKAIEASFERIDEYTKDFHVRDSCVPPRGVNELGHLLPLARNCHEH